MCCSWIEVELVLVSKNRRLSQLMDLPGVLLKGCCSSSVGDQKLSDRREGVSRRPVAAAVFGDITFWNVDGLRQILMECTNNGVYDRQHL
ncbi:hypothetical protein AOLI_G00239110 [Acnodon oligacanthus]